MKIVHIESKKSQEAIDKFEELNPDIWKAYTRTDPETFEIIYCIDCYYAKWRE